MNVDFNVSLLFCLIALLTALAMLLWDVYHIPRHVRDCFARGLVVSTASVAGITLVTVLIFSAQISYMEAQCHAHSDGHPSHSSP